MKRPDKKPLVLTRTLVRVLTDRKLEMIKGGWIETCQSKGAVHDCSGITDFCGPGGVFGG